MDIPFSVSACTTRAGGLRVRYGIASWYRIAMASVFAAISVAVLASGGTGPLGYGALAVSALAAAWTEAWVFDSESGTVSGGAGIAVITARRTVSFDEIEEIEIVDFHRGSFSGERDGQSMPGSQARIILQLKEGPGITLNGVSLRNKPSLQRDAILLAESTGLKIKTSERKY